MKITVTFDLENMSPQQHNLLRKLLGFTGEPFQTNIAKPMAPEQESTQASEQTGLSEIEVDAMGVPWDARIHSSNHNKTAKGIWARRKNIEDDFYNQVIKDLKKAMSVGDAAEVSENVPPPPHEPGTVVPIPPLDYPAFAEIVFKAIAENKITNLQVGTLLRDMGIGTFANIAHRPDLIPTVMEKLGLK